MIDINRKKFYSINNSNNGEVSCDTIFNYYQKENIVWAEYSGGTIIKGNIIGLITQEGMLDLKYHHINTRFELMTGKCKSIPEILPDGRIRFYEEWKWTSGDYSAGKSIIEEIKK